MFALDVEEEEFPYIKKPRDTEDFQLNSLVRGSLIENYEKCE